MSPLAKRISTNNITLRRGIFLTIMAISMVKCVLLRQKMRAFDMQRFRDALETVDPADMIDAFKGPELKLDDYGDIKQEQLYQTKNGELIWGAELINKIIDFLDIEEIYSSGITEKELNKLFPLTEILIEEVRNQCVELKADIMRETENIVTEADRLSKNSRGNGFNLFNAKNLEPFDGLMRHNFGIVRTCMKLLEFGAQKKKFDQMKKLQPYCKKEAQREVEKVLNDVNQVFTTAKKTLKQFNNETTRSLELELAPSQVQRNTDASISTLANAFEQVAKDMAGVLETEWGNRYAQCQLCENYREFNRELLTQIKKVTELQPPDWSQNPKTLGTAIKESIDDYMYASSLTNLENNVKKFESETKTQRLLPKQLNLVRSFFDDKARTNILQDVEAAATKLKNSFKTIQESRDHFITECNESMRMVSDSAMAKITHDLDKPQMVKTRLVQQQKQRSLARLQAAYTKIGEDFQDFIKAGQSVPNSRI